MTGAYSEIPNLNSAEGLKPARQYGPEMRYCGLEASSVFRFRTSRFGPRAWFSALRKSAICLRGPLALLVAILCTSSLVRADDLDKTFDTANKLYEEGKYAEAAAAYEGLVNSNRVSAAVYFNLGNALFKAGRLGRAIDAYTHAERIAPRDPDIRANLQFARNQAQGPTLAPNRWGRWLNELTLNEWTVLAAAALWLWLGLLTLFQWRSELKRNLREHS